MRFLPTKGAIVREVILTVVSVSAALYFAPKIKAWADKRKNK
jgi:hypothetical protein